MTDKAEKEAIKLCLLNVFEGYFGEVDFKPVGKTFNSIIASHVSEAVAEKEAEIAKLKAETLDRVFRAMCMTCEHRHKESCQLDMSKSNNCTQTACPLIKTIVEGV